MMSSNTSGGLIVLTSQWRKPKATCSKCKRVVDRTDNYCRYCGTKFLGTRIITSDK